MSSANSPLLGLAVAVLYGSVAVGANFVNKYAMIILPVPNTILFIKTFTILVVVKCLSLAGLVTLPAITMTKLHEMTPISVVYCLHAGLVLRALMRLSVPMYNTLKRLTPIMVLGAKVCIDRKYPDMNVTLSMLLSVSGCIIAAAGDLSFDSQGYTVALVCAALQATYMMLAEAQTKGKVAVSSASSSPVLISSKNPGSEGYFGGLMSILQKNAGMSPTGARSVPSSPAKQQQQAVAMLLSTVPGTGLEEESGPVSTAIPAWADSKGASGDSMERRPLLSSASETEKAVQRSNSVVSSSGSTTAAKTTKTSPFEILYYMGIVGCPLLLGAVAYSGELEHALIMFQHQYDILGPINSAIWMFWIASVEGLLTGCMIWCAQVNNALTTSIVGVLKGVFATLLGFFLLGGIRFSVVNVTGICITLVGGSWYTWIGYCNTQKKKAVVARELLSRLDNGSEAVDPVNENAPLLSGSKV